MLIFAPYAAKEITNNPNRNAALGYLAFSDEEAEGIGGDIYKNDNATKKRFLETYREHGVIHFATHAQVDDTDPSGSFIAFYPDQEEYKLYTEELYALSMEKTNLVVISACEAGNGTMQKGEGLISIARGFAFAGCPAVITTLWNAHDESTAWISKKLHHYLKKGWHKSDALRQAKIDFLNSDTGKAYDHPYFWANFILIGNDTPITNSYWYTYILYLIPIVVLMVFLWWRFRRGA